MIWLWRILLSAAAALFFCLSTSAMVLWREHLTERKTGEKLGGILAFFGWFFAFAAILLLWGSP